MKYGVFFRHLLWLGTIIVLFATLAFGQAADLKVRFESEYNAWKIVVEGNNISPSMAIANDHLYEIVKMGVPVLPLIVEKMERKEFYQDFQLELAFYLITRKIFETEDWPQGKRGDAFTKAAMFIDWWHNGLKYTQNSFNRYYQEWKRYLAEKKEGEAEDKLLSIKKLGIAAIPFMIEKIEVGDLEFISIISDHTNESLNENASKDECIAWWNENKDKYTIVQVE